MEQPQHPIKISTKLYQGAHIPDVDNEELEEDPGSPITKDVATDVTTVNVTPLNFLSSQLVQIRKKRLEIVKIMKKLRTEHIQLAAQEACVKRLINQHVDD